MSASTTARWLKNVFKSAGIDVSIFEAHSVRGDSSSTAMNMGSTANDILKVADWSSKSVFQKFYYKGIENPKFGRTVLSVSDRPGRSHTKTTQRGSL